MRSAGLGMVRSFFRSSLPIAWMCLIPLAISVANGQNQKPQRVFGRYQHFIWQEQQGLPQNTVQAMTRTKDGYLWLGTLAGVARFDGVHFTVFDSSNTPQIKASYITAFLEDRNGDLWVGVQGGGLALFRDGQFRPFPEEDSLRSDDIRSLAETPDGSLWIGTT